MAQKIVQEDKKKLAEDKAQNAPSEKIAEDLNQLQKDRKAKKELHAKVMEDRKEFRKTLRGQYQEIKNGKSAPETEKTEKK